MSKKIIIGMRTKETLNKDTKAQESKRKEQKSNNY